MHVAYTVKVIEEVVDCVFQITDEALRSIEAVRHLPLPVCHFTREGDLVLANPVAIDLFGRQCMLAPSTLFCGRGGLELSFLVLVRLYWMNCVVLL